jgi:1-acyl-sn-glycerol-3-phosphate acyltransferase
MQDPIQLDQPSLTKRLLRNIAGLLTVGTYTLMAPFGWAFFAVLSFAWRRHPIVCARRLQRIQVFAFRCMHTWLRKSGITDFDYHAPLPGLPDGPCVIIANHPTLMDITAITAMVGGGCTIAKPALFRRMTLRRLLIGAGHVEGPGPDLISAGRVVDEVGERLRQGFRVIIFPEGTRSPPGRLLHFGRLAFEIACRANVPLVSLSITCNPLYLSKNVPLFWPPFPTPKLRVSMLAVDRPSDFEGCSRTLRQRVETRYQAWLAALV